jgi:anti-sigma factor RsiW
MNQAIEHLSPDTLSAFVDGELPTGEQEAIRQHLASCHSCAVRVLSATQLKAATARAGRRFTPSPEALARLTAQLHKKPKAPARIHSIRRLTWAGLAAAFLLALSLIGWRQMHETNSLSA